MLDHNKKRSACLLIVFNWVPNSYELFDYSIGWEELQKKEAAGLDLEFGTI